MALPRETACRRPRSPKPPAERGTVLEKLRERGRTSAGPTSLVSRLDTVARRLSRRPGRRAIVAFALGSRCFSLVFFFVIDG